MIATVDLPLIVLGAGCAGLSLAAGLVRGGSREQIVVVDRRGEWSDDRTWCFWDTGATPHAHLASHSWRSWEVVTEGATAVARARRHPYRHLRARVLYDHLLAELDAAPNVEVQTGTTVRRVEDRGDCVVVETDRGRLVGARAWDAMGATGPLLRGRPAGEVELRQAFLGLEVEVARPVFRPGVATLMDFRVSQEDGLHFVYLLPFSATRALVEDTHIGTTPVTPAARRATVRRYLADHHGATEVTVVREERGNLPMTSWAFPDVRSGRLAAVGAAAGAIRPSSGYAFVRLQRHVAAVARAHVEGRPPPASPQRGRGAALDRVFLQALSAEPERFPEHFRRLVAGVPGDVFARFMSDAGGLGDDLRIMAALPPAPFVRAAAGVAGAARGARAPAVLAPVRPPGAA